MKKKPKWTIENVITNLENDSCSECSYICRTPFECNCEDCPYKDAVATAVEYLKVLQNLLDQTARIPVGYKFVIRRNWERGTDENA